MQPLGMASSYQRCFCRSMVAQWVHRARTRCHWFLTKQAVCQAAVALLDRCISGPPECVHLSTHSSVWELSSSNNNQSLSSGGLNVLYLYLGFGSISGPQDIGSGALRTQSGNNWNVPKSFAIRKNIAHKHTIRKNIAHKNLP